MKKGVEQNLDRIRQRAGQTASLSPEDCGKVPPVDVQRIIGELVHPVRELQAQGGQLEQTRSDSEESHRRITDMLELAPLDYLGLDSQVVVSHANASICDVLGSSRRHLLGSRVVAVVGGQVLRRAAFPPNDMSARSEARHE